jgi:hypothetical protein
MPSNWCAWGSPVAGIVVAGTVIHHEFCWWAASSGDRRVVGAEADYFESGDERACLAENVRTLEPDVVVTVPIVRRQRIDGELCRVVPAWHARKPR